MIGSGSYLPALEFLDRKRWRKHLLHWARTADLSRPGEDGMGRAARRRYMEWEITGDDKVAIEALEACVRKLRLTFEAHTWAEPINDRIWLPDHPLVMMTQGEMSDERNQIWPRHYVSYRGFTDFAAWVREKSDRHVKVWLYSFAERPERGEVRLWRGPLGQYRVDFGPDADGNAVPDRPRPRMLTLHRGAPIGLELPSRRLMALDVRLMKPSKEDFWSRPDLAVSLYGTGSCKADLCVALHNLGNSPAHNVSVVVKDAAGKVVSRRRVSLIGPPLDLKPSHEMVRFTGLPETGDLHVEADPEKAIAELCEDNNLCAIKRRSR